MRQRDDRGITLIELLVGVTVLAVVGFMAGAFLNMSTKLSRRTVTYSDIQEESQNVENRLTTAVMNAKSIYIEKDSGGIVFFTGEKRSASDGTHYTGEIFFYDKDGASLYQKRDADIVREAGTDGIAALGTGDVKSDLARSEYLISNKMESLEISLQIDGKTRTENIDTGALDGPATVKFDAVFSWFESDNYHMNFSATTRNMPESVWFRE